MGVVLRGKISGSEPWNLDRKHLPVHFFTEERTYVNHDSSGLPKEKILQRIDERIGNEDEFTFGTNVV